MACLPQSFKIDTTDNLYYNMKDLYDYKPEYFYGCTVKKRLIIKKKNIPSTEYVYANFLTKTKEWNLSDESCKKAQLLFTKSWADASFFNLNSNASVLLESRENVNNDAIEEPVNITPEDNVELAPSILELEDFEKFRDCDGNIVEIEVRGEKHRNGIYFKVKDVMKAFDMPNLDCSLRDERGNYKINIHYKNFIRVTQGSSLSTAIKKQLYITYKGLIRVLFASNAGTAEKFQDWAEDKLFTIQMGTQEKKEILGTEILNVNLENYRAVFGKYSQGFPCIYLLSLGKVGELRETFGINANVDDNSTVYKYGFTCDIKRRLGEHNKDYGKMPNVNIDLELFNYIDLKYTSEAETDIRDIFESFDRALDITGRKELIALNIKQFDRVKKEYVRTGREFAGATKELQDEITRLKAEIIEMKLKHQLELLHERSEKEKYKTRAETFEYISTLKETHYAQIQSLVEKINTQK
jgi:hypothetical protein